MLYEQRVKAIENEIVPFGIIDDGLEEEKPEVVGGDIWYTQHTTDMY